jgi:hypothetical protein
MRCRRIATASFLALTTTWLSPAPSTAQDLSAERSAQIAAAARLHPGQTVRLALPGQGRVSGTTVPGASGDLMFRPANGGDSVSLAGADTLWVRKRAWVPGMVVGGVVGTAFGALAAAAASDLCDTQSPCVTTGEAIGVSLVSGAIGAVLGAGVGLLIPKWKRSWVGVP